VIEAALAVMDAEGLEAVTMRRIGRELGVEAMSLYNHVRDKDDILEAVTELVMSEFELPPATGDWREDGKNAAREWRRLLRTHPNVMGLMAGRRKPLASPESLRPMDTALGILRGAGLDVRDAAQAFNAFGSYIMGFVIMEQGMMLGHEGPDPEHLRMHEELARLHGAEFPFLVEAFPAIHECSTDEQFEFGLELMMEGLAARAGRAR
jgi:AcrR family transcriptional regulator